MGPVFHFVTVPRGNRAEDLVQSVRHCSKRFKIAYANRDVGGMATSSKEAWNSLSLLFETLRGAQDDGNLPDSFMNRPAGALIDNLTLSDQTKMISKQRLDRSHPNLTVAKLRDVLNKFAHYDEDMVTFRVDGRGAHYIILGGSFKGKRWVCETLVSTFCKNAAAAVEAIG